MTFRLANAASVLLAMTTTMVSLPFATAESICTLSAPETCAVENLKPSDDDGSVLIYPGGNTRCAFDDYQDTATTFSTNSTYFFQVFPNSDLDKSKLMILFQGGGACTGEDTCAFSVQCSLAASATLSTAATSSSAGVLNRSLENNMFRDWNVVFVPYCTGDVHIGNRITEDFESEYVEQLGNSQCLGLNYSMHMNGYNNTMAALDWALQNYPDVDNLVVAGESAGSLAAQIHSAHIAKMWEIDARGARFSVIPDSYVGVQPEEIPGSVSLSYYGACRNDFNWPDDIAAACDAGTASTTEMTEALMEAEPQGNWLFINSKGDLTQRYFYAVIEDGIEGYPYTNLISEEDFYSNMTAILNAYKAVSSRVTTFYVEGTKHVFLADSNFTAYESDEGLLLGDAINALLSGSSVNSTSITNSSTSASATTQTTANSPSIPSATSTTTTSVTSSTPLAC